MNPVLEILVVEDESIIALELRMRLTKLGHRVTNTLRKGEEAVVATAEKCPDLVLMDISLAGTMNGIEAAKKIKETTSASIVFVTANTDPATRREALSANPEGFLLKPFAESEIEEVLQGVIEYREMHHLPYAIGIAPGVVGGL